MTEEAKAIVRQHLERIDGVSPRGLNGHLENSELVKTLVVEVDFATDPNSFRFRQNVLDAIWSTAREVLQNETTMVVSHLRIIPKASWGHGLLLSSPAISD